MQLAIDSMENNYYTIYELAFSNSSINTLREILRDNTCFYAHEHHKLFVSWCQIFPRITTAKVFHRERFALYGM